MSDNEEFLNFYVNESSSNRRSSTVGGNSPYQQFHPFDPARARVRPPTTFSPVPTKQSWVSSKVSSVMLILLMSGFHFSLQTISSTMHREHLCTSQPLEPCRAVLLMLAFIQAFPVSPSLNHNSNNLQRKHNQCRMLQRIRCWGTTTSSRRVTRECNNNSLNSIRTDKTSKHNRLHHLIPVDNSSSHNSSNPHSQLSRRCDIMSSINQHSHQQTVSIIQRRHPRRFPCDFITMRIQQVPEIKSLSTWLHHSSNNDRSQPLELRLISNIRRNRSSCQPQPRLKRHKVRQMQATRRLL